MGTKRTFRKRSTLKNKPLAIDAFCGVGGLSLGLSQAGFEVCLAYDNSEAAITTYNNNLGDHAILADAHDINILLELKRRHLKKGDISLFVGGPPCQGFSLQRRGSDNDYRNDLVKVFFRQAMQIKPRFIVMENVQGITGPRGRTTLDFVEKLCLTNGYSFQINKINAADYGAPQLRKRTFIIAERIDGEVSHFAFPQPTFAPEEYRTVRDAIGDLPSPPEDGSEHASIPNHRCDVLSERNRQRFAHVPQSGGREDIPRHLRLPCHKLSAAKTGHRYVYGRLAWNKPSGVITARFDSLTRGRFGHPSELRSISLREGARLQTFPDDFIFTGTKVEVAREIGNAVPPVLAKVLGESVLTALKQKEKGFRGN